MKNNILAGGILAAAGAATLGAASTLGDWIWARYIPDGAVLPGVVHGFVFFALLAAVLAYAVGTALGWRRLLPSLPLAGLFLAASFYPIALALGYIAGLLVTWAAMWIVLSLLLRWALAGSETLRSALIRGVVAAAGSGLAFWAVSGIWTNPAAAADPLTLARFGAWTFAFTPGLLALMVGQEVRRVF
jgi:hypothetical protein